MAKFDVISADPPWPFRVWSKDTGNGRSAESHYSTMDIDAICALPVGELAADNCALFIWCCWPSLPDAFKVIEAWGFEYKTLGFEWWKLNRRWYDRYLPMAATPGSHPILDRLFHVGMGYYARANSEPCLLAVRGQMPVAVRNVRNYIIAPIQEHSRKPDEQYAKIEALYPDKRYLELFARRKRSGWHSWGNQVDCDIEMPRRVPTATDSSGNVWTQQELITA